MNQLYGGQGAFQSRQYRVIIDGEIVNGVADNVTMIGGKQIAIESKWVKGSWADSPRNPASEIANLPFAIEERSTMLNQAMAYSQAYAETIYHSNSPELIEYYTEVFQTAGITNIKFILTT